MKFKKIYIILPILLLVISIFVVDSFLDRLPQDLSIENRDFRFSILGNWLVVEVDDYDPIPDIIPEKYHRFSIEARDITYLNVYERKKLIKEIELLLESLLKAESRSGSDWCSNSVVFLRVNSGEPFLASGESHTLLNEQILSFACELGKHSSVARKSSMFKSMLSRQGAS